MQVVIGHFLGVDHCGHRFGPSHPAIQRKLGQMNEVIKNVSKEMDDDTLLVVSLFMTGSGWPGDSLLLTAPLVVCRCWVITE